jgi:hypothetical protein
MIGDEGQPNFSAMLAMKSASRWDSHRQNVPHDMQTTRLACGPAELPIVPRLVPQLLHG